MAFSSWSSTHPMVRWLVLLGSCQVLLLGCPAQPLPITETPRDAGNPPDGGFDAFAADTPSESEPDLISPMDPDVTSPDASPDPTPEPEASPQGCIQAANRVPTSEAAQLDEEGLRQLARGRVGLRGRGSARLGGELRHVSASMGDDAEAGTEGAPWRTLQHAAASARPGMTVIVDASGDYRGPLRLLTSGTPGAAIGFKNRNGETPRILGDGSDRAVVEIDASHIVFEGFEIADHQPSGEGPTAIGILIEPRRGDISHIEVRNNTLHHIGPDNLESRSCYYNAHGILASAEGHTLEHLIIDGNELHDLHVGNSECLVINGNVNTFCITNNYIHDVNNIAIDVIGYEQNNRETARDGIVADNVVLDASNYWPYCSRGNCTYPPGDESSDGIYVDGGADILIEYNIVGRTDHGIELQSENGQLIRGVTVRHNLVFNSNYRNFTLGPNEDCREHDNIFTHREDLEDEDLEACRP